MSHNIFEDKVDTLIAKKTEEVLAKLKLEQEKESAAEEVPVSEPKKRVVRKKKKEDD